MDNTLKKVVPFLSEEDARAYVRTEHPNEEMAIILSPHSENKRGNYFVSADDLHSQFIRSWESEIFRGLGSEA